MGDTTEQSLRNVLEVLTCSEQDDIEGGSQEARHSGKAPMSRRAQLVLTKQHGLG